MAELSWEPSVNAAEIGVEVKDGIVTLAGHVERGNIKGRPPQTQCATLWA